MPEQTLVEPADEGGTDQVKTNEFDDTDFSGAGVQLFTGETGKRLSLREVTISPSGQNTVRLEDDAAKNVLPRLNFDTAGGASPRRFVKGHLVSGVGQGIKVRATQITGVSIVASVWIIE